MLLAGDVGGTKTLVGLFRPAPERPARVAVESFHTRDFPDLGSLSLEFLRRIGVHERELERACFGVAGPVKDRRAKLTNVPWEVDADAIASRLAIHEAVLLNDLEALAWSVPVLLESEMETIWAGEPLTGGNAALIAAGTGLGVALLPKLSGAFVPVASEGGHADFAARTSAEEVLRAALTTEFGRSELEQVLSGPGLVNIQRFVYPHTCVDLKDRAPDDLPALISNAALEGRCRECRSSLEMFVSVYGASAGNLALTTLATGGIVLGGGIAPRILAALRWPVFLESFFSKAPLEGLMRRIPVKVILNPEAGLVGAATYINK